jgi:hypothetical protein
MKSQVICGGKAEKHNWHIIISFGLRIFIGRSEAEFKKNKTSVYTTFYFAGIANFLLLFGREEGIKPSPAAAIVW